MEKLFIIALFFGSLLYAQTVTIALAANVSYAMDELQTAFYKKYPDTKLRIIIGGSGKLSAQIKNGAPYDIFMSANMRYPEALYKENIAITKPRIYAQGALAILSQKPRELTQGIKIVADTKIKRIAIANPKTAPYGKAAIQALKNAKLYQKIKPKLIFGESIAQTVTYTMTAADLGFIAKSALYSPKMKQFKKDKNWIEVDANLYTPISQGIVIIKHGSNNNAAKKFYDFILSKEAKSIFKKYGYNIL
ncbi:MULTISPECIES: molybdate ABC transporter substrate-binding protein [Sulfurimonas]|uniref:molybdate ABC transporter substrate-binding protein n=1 Tax=Sulfurimonas TaxID=202746 RepID=UPI001264B724|nr:molybdate ABC transporter substrate-binding protein [Sulfurimonas indica]